MFIDSGISQGVDWNISWGNCAQNPRYCNIAHNHQPKLNLCTLVMDFRNKSYIFIVIKFIWWSPGGHLGHFEEGEVEEGMYHSQYQLLANFKNALISKGC